MSRAIAYLEQLQREFSTMLRTPLDRSTLTLRAQTDRYAGELAARVREAGIDRAERLAVYNRQYWFRLFGVLQVDYRLTTALCGAWTFNDLAARFLLAHPPEGHELAALGGRFPEFLAADLRSPLATRRGDVPRDAVLEAARIDAAFHTATHARYDPPLILGPADAATLATSRLVWASSVTLVDETWPLIAVRRELPADLGDHQAPLPGRHPAPRSWVIHGSANGLRIAPVDPLHAELLRLLRTHAIGDALAMLEARGSAAVAAHAQRWFAEGIQHGYWTRLETAP